MGVVFVFAFMVGSSQAYLGAVYDGYSEGANNPFWGSTNHPAATSTFTVDQLNFDSTIGATYGQFLSGAANYPTNNPNNLQWTGTNLGGQNITTAGGFVGSLFQFTGTAYFPANTVITHDDGFYLTLTNTSGTTSYNYSPPVSPTPTPLNNQAGVYDFVLWYGATNSLPEVLQAPGVAPVPVPAAAWLLASGLIGLLGLRRKFRK